jgi:hypothetical protein
MNIKIISNPGNANYHSASGACVAGKTETGRMRPFLFKEIAQKVLFRREIA